MLVLLKLGLWASLTRPVSKGGGLVNAGSLPSPSTRLGLFLLVVVAGNDTG
jgi:hypothetical protein